MTSCEDELSKTTNELKDRNSILISTAESIPLENWHRNDAGFIARSENLLFKISWDEITVYLCTGLGAAVMCHDEHSLILSLTEKEKINILRKKK